MRLIQSVVCLSLLAACGPTTEVLNSWADPSAGQVRFKKVLNVCACKDEAMRRTVEDQLSKRITGSTPSYTILSEDDLHDRTHLEERCHRPDLLERGIEAQRPGVILGRFQDREGNRDDRG